MNVVSEWVRRVIGPHPRAIVDYDERARFEQREREITARLERLRIEAEVRGRGGLRWRDRGERI